MRYRRDIDGLRAVAVGGVVLYHAFPTLLRGGFVGVDVFFVISGYLITTIIASDAEAGRFSIPGFYERRFRRILPALAFMLVVTSGASMLILPPGELDQYGRSLMSVAGFASNILFWYQGGYFDGPAGDKPLLHTWSLAVEEQFYILWPLIAAALIALGRRKLLRGFLWVTVIASLTAAEIAVRRWPTAAFYLLPYRGWELGFGALLAVDALPELRVRWQREAAAWAGVAFVAGPMLLYTAGTRFPGLAAVPPCLGTLLLIHAGCEAPTRAGRLLSVRPMLYVGLVSYSFYLWHWPVLVLSHIALNRPLQISEAAAAVAVAFVIAAASLRYIEKPFRGRRMSWMGRRSTLAASATILLLFGAAGVAAWRTHGFDLYASRGVREAEAATESNNPLRDRCHVDRSFGTVPPSDGCIQGKLSPDKRYDVLLWGDSHADHLMPGLSEVALRDGFSIRQATVSGCSPLVLAATELHVRDNCQMIHKAILDEAQANTRLKAIVLSTRWSAALTGLIRKYGSNDRAEAVLQTRLSRFLAMIRRAIGERAVIILVGSTPEYDFWPASCFARAAKLSTNRELCRHPVPKDVKYGPSVDALLTSFRRPNVRVALPRRLFCPTGGRCLTELGSNILMRDDDHLTNAGSRIAATAIAPALSAIGHPVAIRTIPPTSLSTTVTG